jgi:steroid 5-alpha reductase family enzyme
MALNTLVWMLSLAKRDAGVIDSFWSLGFVLLAWLWRGEMAADHPRAWLVCGLVTIWGLRLAAHIAWRNRGRGEDPRYTAMRARAPRTFPWTSLVTVFWLQALLLWLIATSIYLALRTPGPLTLLDYAGLALWLFGFLFETVADAQLARFRNRPENSGRVMDRGLWRYSRHPNYFGEACLWWGIGLMAVAGGGWGLAGPALLTFLLLRVSGVTLMDRHLAETRAGFRDYARRTKAFLPRRPRNS